MIIYIWPTALLLSFSFVSYSPITIQPLNFLYPVNRSCAAAETHPWPERPCIASVNPAYPDPHTCSCSMPSSTRSRSISPPSPRVPTPTANDFPTPVGQTFTVPKRDQGLVSPAESAFSFFDEGSPHAMSTSDLMEERARAKTLERGTPGESTYASINPANQQQSELRRNKSQYYTEVFSYREPNLSPRDRISKDSVITAEIKTNVIVRAYKLTASHPTLMLINLCVT